MVYRTLIIAALTAAALPASAADVAAGKALVETNCTKCHDTSVYTRKDRRISDMAALKKQVRRCELSLDLSWFDDQVNNAAAHLNQQYYHFK